MSMTIGAAPGEIAERILLPGDPLRAKWIAEKFLSEVHQFNSIRAMYGFTGLYKGQRISVMGSGMGAPSISLYLHELFMDYQVQIAIRIGTCGAIQDEVNVGDLILPMTASTDSGINRRTTGGLDFAPHADFALLAIAQSLSTKVPVHVGGVASMDMFYDTTDSTERLREHGVLALEMETSALYSLAARKKRRALSILTVTDHLNRHEQMSALAREETLTDMVELSLATISFTE
ncbi:MAG: purine-nucleoside phosphorylase [Actinomycetes bacterium]|jgi:purine-nucleoside phosphorylase